MKSSILRRVLQKKCPRCGIGLLFARWNHLNKRCSHCDLEFIRDHVDYGIFLYFTTAVLTGLFVILFLLIGFPNNWISRSLVVLAALALMWGSMPLRKALAVALEFRMSRLS